MIEIMANMTPEEKRLLVAAKRLRQLVKADIEKTANPAILALVRVLGPHLARLGPKLMQVIRSIPPDVWGEIAQRLVGMIANMAREHGEGVKSASTEYTKAKALRTIASVDKILRRARVSNAKNVAALVVMASVKVAAEHKKSPNPELMKAVQMVNAARAEIALLREFV